MKRYLFLVLYSLTYLVGEAQQLQTQIQAKRGVFTDRLYLNGRWINWVSTDLNTADSANDNVVPTSKAVADYVKLKAASNTGRANNFTQNGGNTVMNTTNETSLLTPGRDPYIIPSAAWHAGKAYRVRMYLAYSTAASSAPTLEIKVKMGSNRVAGTGPFIVGYNKSFVQLYCEYDIICNSIGSMGGFLSCGHKVNENTYSNPGAQIGFFDTTADMPFDVTAQLSDATSGNSISCYLLTLEELN